MRQVIQKIFLHSSLLAILFFSLVALLDNKNILIFTITSNVGHPVSAELYYTSDGKPFSDEKKSHVYKIKDNRYYMLLPSLDEIQYARFDPARSKREITIAKDILLISNHWFVTTVRVADITKSEPAHQIKNFTRTAQGVHFQSTGRDPQININLTPVHSYSYIDRHYDTLGIALLLYLVILFLYHLYKKKTFSNFESAKLILYALFLTFGLFKVDYYKDHVHSNYTPDSIAHLSYIQYIHTHHELMPSFENMYMVTNKNAGNYLGHPPLYYYLMNLMYNKTLSITGNIENFRNLNVVLFTAALLLFFYIGFEMKIALLGHLVYLTFLTSLPMHAYLGSAITNDNLAILGAAIFAVGFLHLIQKRYTNTTYFLIGLGGFVAFFGKLTAALLIFFALLFLLLFLWRKKESFSITKSQVALVTLFLIPVIAYQSYILLHYHAVVPTLNVTHPEEYKHSVYFIPEALREYKTPLEWLGIYWHYIHTGWFGIHSHYSFYKFSIVDYFGLLMLHIFALIALVLSCKNDRSGYCIFGKITMGAFLIVAFIQVAFSYKVHLHSGYTGGLQARYLLPFMFSFAIMASVFINRFSKNFFFTIGIMLLCIQALYSDFFYFLKHYA